jgi:hypothetical protein
MSIRMLTTKYPRLSPNINQFDLMSVWGDLLEAYHGVNSYAGNTAEIYSHLLRRNSLNGVIYAEDVEDSVDNLAELCKYFSGNYNVRIQIDGMTINQWKKKVYSTGYARAHVKVSRRSR